MEVLNSKISLCISFNDEGIKEKEDGSFRILLKPNESTNVAVTIDKRFKKIIGNYKSDKEAVLFVQGSYKMVKNKKGTILILVETENVDLCKKEKVLNYKAFNNNIYSEFRSMDLTKLKEKYSDKYGFDILVDLKEQIERIKILELQEKINRQELEKKSLEAKLLKNDKKVESNFLESNILIKKNWKYFTENNEFIELNVNDIYISDIHKEGFANMNLNNLYNSNDPIKIVVKDNKNGSYNLLIGIKGYLKAKILNKPALAFVTDLERENFIEQINVLSNI